MKVTTVMRAGLFPLLVSFLLISCASLPLPDTPEKSLLVFALDITHASTANADGGRTVGITFQLTDVKHHKELSIPIPLDRKYTTVAVDPGAYTISSMTVSRGWFQSGVKRANWVETQTLGRAVYVEQQTVLLCTIFTYTDRSDPDKGYGFYIYQASSIGDRGAVILADMKKDRHWQAWEGYQMVNFPEQ
jgi:hypothetical protein